MKIVTSKDGTKIAYDVYGKGQPVIMVGGTMNSRLFGPAPGAKILGDDFAVYDYDRRGRGDSSDNKPYSPHKEVEDIAALIEAAGGKAALCGFSAGAALAMEAAIELGAERVTRLVMYEGPYTRDSAVLKEWQDYGTVLRDAVDSDNVEALVMAFIKLVHAEDQVDTLKKDKATWQKLLKLAPTLIYDYEIIGPTKQVTEKRFAQLSIPTLVICGGNSGTQMINDTRYIAKLMAHGSSMILSGQSHSVESEVIAPVLRDFLI